MTVEELLKELQKIAETDPTAPVLVEAPLREPGGWCRVPLARIERLGPMGSVLLGGMSLENLSKDSRARLILKYS